ncbi:MAG: GNAT family N-acetyltransferase [Planctomycetaceae bacterium]
MLLVVDHTGRALTARHVVSIPNMKSIDLPLETGELTLRRVHPDDRADLFEFYGGPDVWRFQFWGPWTIEQIDEIIAGQSDIRIGDPGVPLVLIVVLRSEAKVIGDYQLTINSPEDRQGEMGFSFNPAYAGRPYDKARTPMSFRRDSGQTARQARGS